MVERLWVPLTQRLVARNWNLAMSVSPFTASSVANRVAVSTPLRTGLSVVVMDLLLNSGCSGATDSLPDEIRRSGPLAHPWPPRICRHGACHGRLNWSTLERVTTASRARSSDVTAREAEVLALIARHLTNAQIAEALFISTRTVETHVSALLRKLQVSDRRSLARHAEAVPRLVGSPGRRPLSAPLTSFVGRSTERAVLATALAEHRMVTATGPGGVGKTRLALSVAGELAPGLRDGAWFVDLAQLTDPAMVGETLAKTIGVPEQQTVSTDRALIAALTDQQALLVLDNCEHVLNGVR